MPRILPKMGFLKKIAKGDEKTKEKQRKPHCVDPSPEVMAEITSSKKKK